MGCAICGLPYVEEAHTKSRCTFCDLDPDHKWANIIPFCPSHHTDFDRGLVGIFPDKSRFLLDDGKGNLRVVESRENIHHIKDDYVSWKNSYCTIFIRIRLGLVLGLLNLSWA